MQDRRHWKEAMLAAIDLAKEPAIPDSWSMGYNSHVRPPLLEITIVGRANREKSALSRLQVSFNKL